MSKTWLYLNRDTFIWFNSQKCCIYNSLNGKIVISKIADALEKVIPELSDINNLYRVCLPDKIFTDDIFRNWVDRIIQIEAGGISSNPEDIISLKPVLKIQTTKDLYKWKYDFLNDSHNIMDNLHKIVIHMNGSDYGNNFYFKQVLFPQQLSKDLSIEAIEKFIDNSRKSTYLSKICLVGDLSKYPNHKSLINCCKKKCFRIVYYCLEKDYIENIKFIDLLDDSFRMDIIMDDVLNSKKVPLIHPFVSYTFIVSSDEEVSKVEYLIDNFNIGNYKIIPVYTGTNISFIEDNLYMCEEDFENIQLTKREIFAHQALNTHDFGTVTIGPDGSVYTNTFNEPIGSIENSPHNIVLKEITEGENWLKIRDNEPCCQCIYQWLCPSPSNYEYAIGRTNLCHIMD